MLSLDANLVVVFAVIWVLVFVLSRLFFNPVRRVRDRRERGIADDQKAGQAALEAYEKNLAGIEASLKEARVAADAARNRLEQEAAKEKNKLLADISAEGRRQIDEARAEMERTARELKAKLAEDAADLAGQIEKKLLN
jgi:F0F1-type ATP synthase membrane subunit b/b'